MKTSRESHITAVPKKKAIATDTKMAMMTLSALLEFIRSVIMSDGSAFILKSARMKVAPRSSKTSDTVVEVGMPRVLKMSSTTTSVTITASNIVITSAKV